MSNDLERISMTSDIRRPFTKEEAIEQELFVCYECKGDRCDHCIGIPCMCPCPIPMTEPEYSI